MRTLLRVACACALASVSFAACTSDSDSSPSLDLDGGKLDLDGGPSSDAPASDAPASDTSTADTSPSDAGPQADGTNDAAGGSAIVQLAAGFAATCARRADGTVWCWGEDDFGELGRGTASNTPRTPGPVVGITDAVDVAVGQGHMCIVRATGAVVCFGQNPFGQLGDGTTGASLTGTNVVDTVSGTAFADAVKIESSYFGAGCIRRTSGAVVCWGEQVAAVGLNGDGTTDARRAPGANATGITGATALSKGDSHACVLLPSGGPLCWGADTKGQCATGAIGTTVKTPVTATSAANAVEIHAGYLRTCWRLSSGSVKCVGNNDKGFLGNGGKTTTGVATDVQNLSDAAQLTGNESHTCARRTNGKVSCWGINTSGQLGDGTTQERLTAVEVVGLTSNVTQVAAGKAHTCVLLDTGAVMCWGLDNAGQFGTGTTSVTPSGPVLVAL